MSAVLAVAASVSRPTRTDSLTNARAPYASRGANKMRCLADDRDAARSAARQLETDARVLAIDVLDRDTGPVDDFTLELTLDRTADGLPPAIAAELAERQLTIRSVKPRGRCWHVIARA